MALAARAHVLERVRLLEPVRLASAEALRGEVANVVMFARREALLRQEAARLGATSVEVFQTSSTAQPAWSSGWHVHTGPVIVNITAGTMTFYQPAMSGNHVKRGEGHNSCTTTTVSAGHTFLETPGTPVVARNEGTVAVSWLTTQIIPVGASKREDSTSSFCSVP